MLDSLHTPASPLLAFGFPMGAEWIVIGALGLLIFGKRLPDVGRGIGGAIKSFQEGLRGAGDETDEASETPAPAPAAQLPGPSQPAQKFDPYTGKPLTNDSASS